MKMKTACWKISPAQVFVEWSKANELTDGVNYPSNMLYSATLLAASRLYKKEEYRQKGLRIRFKSGSSPLTRNGSVIMRCVQIRQAGQTV